MAKVKRADSRSDLQKMVETLAVMAFSKQAGIALAPKRLTLDGCTVDLDGYAEHADGSRIWLVEAWAHIGKARGAQPKKVLADVLKLAFAADELSRTKANARIEKYFLFVDSGAAEVLQGRKWGAAAARRFGVLPQVVQLEDQMRAAILEIQKRQDIRNGS